MALKRITSERNFDSYLKNYISAIEALIIRNLSVVGEKCVTAVRDRKQEESWYDQTGNLRSSIGYIIVVNGEVVSEGGFNQVKGGAEGVNEGKRFAKNIAKEFARGFALIVVAGMRYASHVEAMENKDVLASSELLAKKLVPEMLKKLGL